MNFAVLVGYGKDNVDKATISLTLARTALEGGESVSVILVSEGTRLALKDYADDLDNGEPFKPIRTLLDDVQQLGGKLHVCMPCLKNRGVAEEDILDQFARIAGPDVIGILKDSERTIQL